MAVWLRMGKRYRHIVIGSLFHRGCLSRDGVKQVSAQSGQNSVHLVRYKTETREVKYWSTVIGVVNTYVRNLWVILDSELLIGGATSHSYVVPVFSSFIICVRFTIFSHRNWFSCSRTALSATGSTTVTASSTVPAGLNLTVSNPSWSQRWGSFWGYRSSPISQPAFEASFIGFQFISGPSSRSASSFGTAWSALPQLTSRNSASPFPQTPAVGAFVRRVEGTSLSQEWIQLDFGGAVSLCLGLPSVTPYRRKFDKPWTIMNCSVDSYQKSVPHQFINQSINQSWNWVYFWGVLPDGTLKLHLDVQCPTTVMFRCSGTQIYNPEVSLALTIKPHDLVSYLGLEPTLHARKGKVISYQSR